MWSKDDLKRIVEERARLRVMTGPKTERAALLYARWQGMTDEPGTVRESCKTQLDALIDVMEPKDWDSLADIVPKLGDKVFKGLLQYGIDHSLKKTTRQAREISRHPDWPVREQDDDRTR